MCGRFTLHTPVAELVERFSLQELKSPYPPSYNIAPTHQILTITTSREGRTASNMRWGLIPPWQKQPQSRPPLINARLETLAEKPTFRGLVNTKRCLIIADGFFEWVQEDSRKCPVYITLEKREPFAFAGLWDNEDSPSCTIITQAASPILEDIHHRMPLILTLDSEIIWLSARPFAEVRSLLPDPEKMSFEYHRVSTLVNSPRNNEASLILPID